MLLSYQHIVCSMLTSICIGTAIPPSLERIGLNNPDNLEIAKDGYVVALDDLNGDGIPEELHCFPFANHFRGIARVVCGQSGMHLTELQAGVDDYLFAVQSFAVSDVSGNGLSDIAILAIRDNPEKSRLIIYEGGTYRAVYELLPTSAVQIQIDVYKIADVNKDGLVTASDVAEILGTTEHSGRHDVDIDGVVDMNDVLRVVESMLVPPSLVDSVQELADSIVASVNISESNWFEHALGVRVDLISSTNNDCDIYLEDDFVVDSEVVADVWYIRGEVIDSDSGQSVEMFVGGDLLAGSGESSAVMAYAQAQASSCDSTCRASAIAQCQAQAQAAGVIFVAVKSCTQTWRNRIRRCGNRIGIYRERVCRGVCESFRPPPPAQNNCPNPCPPPNVRVDWVPPSVPHFPCAGHHWHFQVYNQNPVTCVCYPGNWQLGNCLPGTAFGTP